jgi:hypothetical protein
MHTIAPDVFRWEDAVFIFGGAQGVEVFLERHEVILCASVAATVSYDIFAFQMSDRLAALKLFSRVIATRERSEVRLVCRPEILAEIAGYATIF